MGRAERRILGAGLLGLLLLVVLAIIFHPDLDGSTSSSPSVRVPTGGVTVTVAGKTATVTGTVASKEVEQAVLAAAKVATPDGSVDDQLKVAPGGLSASWLAPVVQALPQPGEGFKNLRLDLTAKTIKLSGVAPTRAARRAAEGRIGAALVSFPGVRATNATTVAVSPDAKQTQAAIDAAIKGGTISFQVGSAVLTPVGTRILDRIVVPLKRFAKVSVLITGYTDNTGSAADNLTLSRARAAAVRTYLSAKGIASSRLTARGRGIANPIGDNRTAAGRAKNRRITFQVQ